MYGPMNIKVIDFVTIIIIVIALIFKLTKYMPKTEE